MGLLTEALSHLGSRGQKRLATCSEAWVETVDPGAPGCLPGVVFDHGSCFPGKPSSPNPQQSVVKERYHPTEEWPGRKDFLILAWEGAAPPRPVNG
jgi:hypothetical protein